MIISNLAESVVYDFGPKKYIGAKGSTNVKLVGNIFYVTSVENNNKFSIKFSFADVSLPKLDSALNLYKQLVNWQTGVSSSSGGVINTTISTDDDYIYWLTPDGKRKKSAGTLAPET